MYAIDCPLTTLHNTELEKSILYNYCFVFNELSVIIILHSGGYMRNEVQEIYINLDDSGKLSSKEDISVYGGVVFLSKKEKDKFITQYKKIINEVKCEYCKICNHVCPEIKNTNIKPEHKRW